MRLNPLTTLALAVLVTPVTAFGAEFSYRYVDVAHFPEVEIDAGSVDVDGDGVQLRGSLPVYQNFFALAEFQDLSLDNNVDATRFLIGGGAYWSLGANLDVIARGGVVHYEVDVGPFDDDDTGLFIGGRLRAIVAPNLEVEGGVEHVRADVAGMDNDTYLVGEGRYNFTPQWSAGVLVTLGGDVSTFGVHGRFSF